MYIYINVYIFIYLGLHSFMNVYIYLSSYAAFVGEGGHRNVRHRRRSGMNGTCGGGGDGAGAGKRVAVL